MPAIMLLESCVLIACENITLRYLRRCQLPWQYIAVLELERPRTGCDNIERS